MNAVIIHWNDIAGQGDRAWMSADEVNDFKPVPMITVGYLLVNTDDFVVVAGTKSTMHEDDSFGNVNAIPKSCITKIQQVCDTQSCKE